MNDHIEITEELAALSQEQVFAALDEENGQVTAFLETCIAYYAKVVGEELKEGRDYLPRLTPPEGCPPIQALAMAMVLEAVEEELESEYDE